MCGVSDIAKVKLDKPNLHRLIELYTHSIPAMGHVRHFAELVFEFAHQPLKRGIVRSNPQNPQIQAVKHALADDWQDRFAALAGRKSVVGTQEFEIQLRAFLCGTNASPQIRSHESGYPALHQPQADGIFIEPLLKKLLRVQSPQSDNQKTTTQWTLTRRDSPQNQGALVSILNRVVMKQYGGPRQVLFFKAGKRSKESRNGSQSFFRPADHDAIRRGDAVQAIIHRFAGNYVLLHQPSRIEILSVINKKPKRLSSLCLRYRRAIAMEGYFIYRIRP